MHTEAFSLMDQRHTYRNGYIMALPAAFLGMLV